MKNYVIIGRYSGIEKQYQVAADENPTKQIAEPNEIAQVAHFLLSEKSSLIPE